MFWLKEQLVSLKIVSKKWPVTEPLEFEPLSVWSRANLLEQWKFLRKLSNTCQLFFMKLNNLWGFWNTWAQWFFDSKCFQIFGTRCYLILIFFKYPKLAMITKLLPGRNPFPHWNLPHGLLMIYPRGMVVQGLKIVHTL